MKLSISLGDDDVAFIDRYAAEYGVDSRSAVVQRAIAVLRALESGEDYAAAWEEWERSEGHTFDVALSDGLGSAEAS